MPICPCIFEKLLITCISLILPYKLLFSSATYRSNLKFFYGFHSQDRAVQCMLRGITEHNAKSNSTVKVKSCWQQLEIDKEDCLVTFVC